jgi:hypothetical protein
VFTKKKTKKKKEEEERVEEGRKNEGRREGKGGGEEEEEEGEDEKVASIGLQNSLSSFSSEIVLKILHSSDPHSLTKVWTVAKQPCLSFEETWATASVRQTKETQGKAY